MKTVRNSATAAPACGRLTAPAAHRPGGLRLGALILGALSMAACVQVPYRRDLPPPPQTASPALYFYPSQGQTSERQERDRFECYQWARQQTGTDPGMTPVSRAAPPYYPGQDRAAGAAVGAVAGAVVGAAVSSPRHAGGGMVLGAVIGSLIGAAGDNERAQAAERADSARYQRSQARANPAVHDFARAMSACMSARGYSVG